MAFQLVELVQSKFLLVQQVKDQLLLLVCLDTIPLKESLKDTPQSGEIGGGRSYDSSTLLTMLL